MKGILYYIHTYDGMYYGSGKTTRSNKRFTSALSSNNLDILFQNHKYCGVIGNVALSRYFYGSKAMIEYLRTNNYLQSSGKTLSQVDFTLSVQGAILKHVLQPTQLVLSAMQSIFLHYQTQPYIGIHLRAGGKLSDMNIEMWFLSEDQIKTSLSFFQKFQQNEPSTYFYLSTDSSFVRNKAFYSFGGKHLISKNESVVIVDSQFNTSHHSEQLLSAIADLMILGNSSACYGTYGSTFTHVGCGMSGGMMYVIGRPYSTYSTLTPFYPFL